VQEYSNMENRDIWEYRLDYTADEIRQLIRHVWELLLIDSDYYFFSENCAYRLLALLDVLREDSNFTVDGHFPLYAIPVDTVRALDQAGLIRQRSYRPSLASRLRNAMQKLDGASRRLVIGLADGRQQLDAIRNLSPADQVAVLDATTRLLQFRRQGGSDRAQVVLSARSRLPAAAAVPASQPQPTPPEQGHASARIGVAAGQYRQAGLLTLQIRPAFHDLLDAPAGYVPGAAINVLETELWLWREFDGDTQLRLQQLSFINIRSLPAVTDWYRPLSWSLDVRLQQQSAAAFAMADDFISLQTRLAAGQTYALNPAGSTKAYALLLADMQLADAFDQGYAVLPGLQLGGLLYGAAGQFHLQLETLRDIAGHASEQRSLQLQYQYNLQANSALRLSARWRRYANEDETEWQLGWLRYF